MARFFRPFRRLVAVATAPDTMEVMVDQTADAAELIAFQAEMAAPEMDSHIPMTADRNPSLVFQRITMPATSAAMAIITRTTGLAAMMKLNAAMAPLTTRMAPARTPRTAATVRTTVEFSLIHWAIPANAWVTAVTAGSNAVPRV